MNLKFLRKTHQQPATWSAIEHVLTEGSFRAIDQNDQYSLHTFHPVEHTAQSTFQSVALSAPKFWKLMSTFICYHCIFIAPFPLSSKPVESSPCLSLLSSPVVIKHFYWTLSRRTFPGPGSCQIRKSQNK